MQMTLFAQLYWRQSDHIICYQEHAIVCKPRGMAMGLLEQILISGGDGHARLMTGSW